MNLFDENYFAKHYGKNILRGNKPLHTRFWIRYIRRLKPEGKLLELGCGEGFFLQKAERYYDASGVDISKYALDIARRKCKKAKLYLKDIRKLPFNARNWDIIVCFDLLEHLNEPRVVIRRCSEVLRYQGLLIISVPNPRSLGRIWKRDGWHGFRDPSHVSLLPKE